MDALMKRRRKPRRVKVRDHYTPSQAAQILGRSLASIDLAISLGRLRAYSQPYWESLGILPLITRRELVRYGITIGVAMNGGGLK